MDMDHDSHQDKDVGDGVNDSKSASVEDGAQTEEGVDASSHDKKIGKKAAEKVADALAIGGKKKQRTVELSTLLPTLDMSKNKAPMTSNKSKGKLKSKEVTLNKGKEVMTTTNKAPMASSNSGKSDATPTSKFMGSAIKAANSRKTMFLVPPRPKKVLQVTSSSVSASTSGTAIVKVLEDKSASVQEGEEEIEEKEEKPKRGRKRTSWVWAHYTKSEKKVKLENGSIVTEHYAKCNRCKYEARCESTNGTHAFSNHLIKVHSVVKGQQLLCQDENGMATYRYNEETSLRYFYDAIIMHEYPFTISGHKYLVRFIKSLQPSFPLKSRVTIRKDIMDLYKEEKNKLYEHFKTLSCRFSFTMDMWTSIQNKAYMCVTAHWVDNNWNMQKRIINFINVEGSHSGIKLGDTFYSKNVLNWNLDKKLFALSLDNASSNKVAIDVVFENARGLLVCGGKFLHVRCANHILNLVARDGLEIIGDAIGNIREFITMVKRSPQQLEAFEKCAQECGLDSKKALSLDVATRWNSTYIMIRDAIYYKDAFDRLALKDRARYAHVTPSSEDWLNARTICKCLKRFYDVTLIFSGTSYPTANHFYRKFCEIKIAIGKWCFSSDEIISSMANVMEVKFDKYWEMSNMALAVAAFLDPRYKHKMVELYISTMHSHEMAEIEKMEFMKVVNELFTFYSSTISTASTNKVSSSKESDLVSSSKFCLLDDEDENEVDLNVLYQSTDNVSKMSELDVYMNDGLLQWDESNAPFDILSWWKGQMSNFPILSHLARDVLSMQVSTVASEAAFSAGGRVIDSFRSRLAPDIVEALVCTKDWMIASEKDLEGDIATIIHDMEMEMEEDVET